MKKELKKYLAEIGMKGGKVSRRKITPAQQAAMQEARKAARLRKEQNAPDELPTGRGGHG
jgi:hypothetical protein